MDADTLLTAIVTIASAAPGYGTIHWRLARLEKLVEAQALERAENHVRVSQIEKRLEKLEGELIAQ
mgnify:FL=1